MADFFGDYMASQAQAYDQGQGFDPNAFLPDAHYGLTPTLLQQQQHQFDYLGQDATQFDMSMFVDPPSPPRPLLKRSISSNDSTYALHPTVKKTRLSLNHMESEQCGSERSAKSSDRTQSTATSQQDSSNESRSPPSDNGFSPLPEPSHETRSRKSLPTILPAGLPRTSSGETPSVLLPYPTAPSPKKHSLQEFAALQEARASAAAEAQQKFAALQQAQAAAGAAQPAHPTRRSKAAAMQHLGEITDQEREEDPAPVSKSKAQPKKQTRKKGTAKAAQVVQEEEDDSRSVGEGDGEGKRTQFLERNRVAACKSRQKKKEWIKSLEDKSEDLTRHNSDLQVLVTALRDEIAALRGALANHAGCACQDGNGAPAGNQDVNPALPHSAEAATFAAAPWVGMGQSPEDGQAVPPTPSVIEFHHAHQPTGLTPFLNTNATDTDYFTQSFSSRSALDTPELARSLGYGV